MTKSAITNAELMVKTRNEISSVALVLIADSGGSLFLCVSSFGIRHGFRADLACIQSDRVEQGQISR